MPSLSSLRLLGEAARVWLDRNAFQHAGALAFYTLFSMAPLMIILVAIIGVVYGEEAASGEIFAWIRDLLGNQAAAAVADAVGRSRPAEAGLLPTALGIGALLFGATTVFAQMQSSLNQFWDVRGGSARSGILAFVAARLLSLGMVLILGFLLLISFAVSVAIAGAMEYAGHWIAVPPLLVVAVDLALSLLVTTAVFGMLFRVLPDVQLQWSDVWRGALFTAILFVLGQYLITLYLTRVAPTSTYGAAGALVLVLFWVYYSALILYFGTAMTKVAILRRDGVVMPKVSRRREPAVLQ